jgi:hypothetical protein
MKIQACKVKGCTGHGSQTSWVDKYGQRKTKHYFTSGFCIRHLQQLKYGIIDINGNVLRALKKWKGSKKVRIAKNPRGKNKPRRENTADKSNYCKVDSDYSDFYAGVLPSSGKVGPGRYS